MSWCGWQGKQVGAALFGGILLLAGAAPAVAADKETRTFNVTIDRRQAGSYTMTISRQEDGSIKVVNDANIEVRILLIKYRYTFQGTEVWKDGRLTQFKSSTNDDGKKFEVNAWPEGNQLRVQINGQDQTARTDVWTTTYWRLADARFRNKELPLLDADTGESLNGMLRYVGRDQITINGAVQNCTHYRVRGGKLDVNLWYDAQERMVRQESVEDGHRTVLALTSIE
jgi:hypothetical protein